MAALGSGEALIASGLAGIVQVLGEAAIWADGRRRVVATALAEMEPDQVEEWLQHDTCNLTLAVQAVIQATAAFDHQKIDALGRVFRSGVTDSARVDESLLVVLALGALERPHIDPLHVVACEEPLLWSEQHDQANERKDARPRVVHCWSDEAAAALARGDASSGAHAPHKRHHTAYGELRWPDNDVQLMPLGRLCVDCLSGARHSYGVQNPPEPLVRGRSTSSAARQEARHCVRRQLGVSM